jgi:hypothetical protein
MTNAPRPFPFPNSCPQTALAFASPVSFALKIKSGQRARGAHTHIAAVVFALLINNSLSNRVIEIERIARQRCAVLVLIKE